MALDRDLGVAVLRAYAERTGRPLRGWEMLAATGVRGLRLVNESAAFSELWLTEIQPPALEVLEGNARRFTDAGARVRRWDAAEPLPGGPFDYVDVDPFGTPVPFLGAAFAALADGGLLAVTATDMPVLAGVQADACEQRYGARPVRGRLGPEGGLRILLAWLARGAASRDRSIHSLLAYVHDHHVRCYVTVASPAGPAPLATVTNSGLPFPVLPGPGPYGPMWVGPLLDAPFVRRLSVPHGAEHARELSGWLARFREESEVDVPFYFEPNTIARALGLPRPPPLEALIQGLRARGFRAGRSPVRPSAFRTDAPRAVLEEVARAAVPAGIGGTGPARPTGPTPSGGS